MSALDTFIQHTEDCDKQRWWKKETVCDCGCDEAGDELAALRALLKEAGEALEPLADFLPHLEIRMKDDEDSTYYEVNSGGVKDARINRRVVRRAAELRKRIEEALA